MVYPTPLVLVVDDNEMNRDMLSRRLQRQNCDVLTAENGQIALDIIASHPIDLVLLDIMMPVMSGYDVLERLKADETTRSLPVIMISAVDDMDSVVRCIELGAEDYLFKPFNPTLLKARITATLGKRQLEREFIPKSALLQPIATLDDLIQQLEGGQSASLVAEGLAQTVTALNALISPN